MKTLNDFLKLIDSYIGSANWFAYALLGIGVFYTLYLGFPQLRFFGHALRVVRGQYDKEGDQGDTSHFQALTTALSSTVGTGNIAGVALAIYIGGPAALFWMLMTATFGMATKFVEVTLSHKYREQAEDGTMSGGPMYYMAHRLNITRPNGRVVKTGSLLAIIFSVGSIINSFGTGNLPQSNSIATAMHAAFGIPQWVVGVVLGTLLFLTIIGGIRRIAIVTERLVPFMVALYILGALAVILANAHNILPSLHNIFGTVLSGSAAAGGFLGAAFNFAFIKGVGRGLFSNEAGMGTAPIAHAAAKTDEPVSEGMVSLLEPFVDTIIICTLTGLVLLSSGVWCQKHQNTFEAADLLVLAGELHEEDEADRTRVFEYLNRDSQAVALYSGTAQVSEGTLASGGFTLIHARSFAEDVEVLQGGAPYSGTLSFAEGAIATPGITLTGRSLIHSAPLTAEAFKRGWFGELGQYIIPIGLLLFAFSTAIVSSYYGDRSLVFLGGGRWLLHYRLVYVLAFVLASFTDTTIIWNLAAVAIACITLPNLLGIVLLRKEMRQTVRDYWTRFYQKHPQHRKK